jgi:outer membrane protein OmpA-like peptidoglycan-associated protein
MLRLVVLSLIVITLALGASAQAKRAFIVGVSDYTDASNQSGIRDLSKPVEDARAYAERFTALGWEVTLLTDPAFSDFAIGFGDFVDSLTPRDEVVFVFSGHGWSAGAENYLTFTDTPFDPGKQVTRSLSAGLTRDVLVPLQRLDREEADRPKIIVAIVDACRERPFPEGATMSLPASSMGLVPIEPAEGMIIIQSARFGQFAWESLGETDTSPHSAFNRFMLAALEDPARPLHSLAFDVRDAVKAEAEKFNKRQAPAVYAEISRDYCLQAPCRSASLAQSPAAMAWAQAQAADTIEAYRGYIALFGDDAPNAGQAREEIVKRTPSVRDILNGGSAWQPKAALTDAGGACGNMLATLYFEYDSLDLTVDSVSLVEEVLARTTNCDIASVTLVGHDDTGTRDYAMQIAGRRADRLKDELTRYGIDPALISAESRGRELPVFAGQRSPYNRRVEMQVDFISPVGPDMTPEDFDAVHATLWMAYAGSRVDVIREDDSFIRLDMPEDLLLDGEDRVADRLFDMRLRPVSDLMNAQGVMLEIIMLAAPGPADEGLASARRRGELILDRLGGQIDDGTDRVRLYSRPGERGIALRILPFPPEKN